MTDSKTVCELERAVQRREKILFIRLTSLGDVLFTLPSVNAVREKYPEGEIHFLVKDRCAFVLQGFPPLDQVARIERGWYRATNPVGLWRGTVGLVRRLQKERYSRVIDLHGLAETALLTRLTGAPRRLGFVWDKRGRAVYTRTVQHQRGEHPADRGLRLLREDGIPTGRARNEYRLPAGQMSKARAWFREAGLLPERPTLFLQPFSSTVERDWPLEKYLALAEHWQHRGVQVVFGGSRAERERILAGLHRPFPVSAGAGFFLEAALMRLATVVIGGDSGMPHLAAALGCRVIMLKDVHCPLGAFPYGHPEWAVLPDGQAKVATLGIERVNAAVEKALEQAAPPAHRLAPG